jgi:RNA polymerase sigma factor (sigma-70 family)
VDFADRVQAGNLGLLRAADKFDGSKGYKFSTYASWWIRQSIDRNLADTGRTIRIPVHMQERLNKVGKITRSMSVRLGREPTVHELAEATELDVGAIQAALELMRPIRSLDELLGEDADLRLSDILAVDDECDGRTDPAHIVAQTTFKTDVTRVLWAVLPVRSACVIERRYGLYTGESETLDSIGADLGVTRERVRQIEGKSLAKLSESKEVEGLRSYIIEDAAISVPRQRVERKAS